MKLLLSIAVFSLFYSGSLATENPTKPTAPQTWMGFDAGLKEAQKSNRKVLVDVYTDWCGWCKKMDKEVFAHVKIAPYLSEQYVLVKLNAESAARLTYKDAKYSESELAKSFGVTGYPTLLFLEPNGDLITTLPGYVPAEDFFPVLKYFAESHYKKIDWQLFYDQYRKDNSAAPSQR